MSKTKSALGHIRKVTEPPGRLGKPWWTEPPTTLPLEEHIAFAEEFRSKLHGRMPSGGQARADWQELMSRVTRWIRAANRIFHSSPVAVCDMGNDEDLWVAALLVVSALFKAVADAGVDDPVLTPDVTRYLEAVKRRGQKARDGLRRRRHGLATREQIRREVGR